MLLIKHKKKAHLEEVIVKTKQFNCEDCPFQAETRDDLRKHLQRTKHKPSEYTEECYTCKMEFSSYWFLMNHRKSEHPSTKICRYFKVDACDFDAETCWYKHENKNKPVPQEFSLECKECDYKCSQKASLMKHVKTEHTESVPICRKFKQNKCELTDENCWFLHIDNPVDNKLEEDQENTDSSDFCEAAEKAPPDQMNKLMNMIMKISLQVESLEKRTKRMM